MSWLREVSDQGNWCACAINSSPSFLGILPTSFTPMFCSLIAVRPYRTNWKNKPFAGITFLGVPSYNVSSHLYIEEFGV